MGDCNVAVGMPTSGLDALLKQLHIMLRQTYFTGRFTIGSPFPAEVDYDIAEAPKVQLDATVGEEVPPSDAFTIFVPEAVVGVKLPSSERQEVKTAVTVRLKGEAFEQGGKIKLRPHVLAIAVKFAEPDPDLEKFLNEEILPQVCPLANEWLVDFDAWLPLEFAGVEFAAPAISTRLVRNSIVGLAAIKGRETDVPGKLEATADRFFLQLDALLLNALIPASLPKFDEKLPFDLKIVWGSLNVAGALGLPRELRLISVLGNPQIEGPASVTGSGSLTLKTHLLPEVTLAATLHVSTRITASVIPIKGLITVGMMGVSAPVDVRLTVPGVPDWIKWAVDLALSALTTLLAYNISFWITLLHIPIFYIKKLSLPLDKPIVDIDLSDLKMRAYAGLGGRTVAELSGVGVAIPHKAWSES